MTGVPNPSLGAVRTVALHMGSLTERVLFLGGAATAFLITDPAAPSVRPTKDVDVIVEVGSRGSYRRLEESLRARGFVPDKEEGAPLCRWVVDGVKVDIMPTDPAILGFSNRWYLAAIKGAMVLTLDSQLEIRVITAPYFLATKLEAFGHRGAGDYQASHDLEDIVSVADGRPSLVEEIAVVDPMLRAYLAQAVRGLLGTSAFLEALPGHLPGNPAGQARLPTVRARLESIADLERRVG